MGCCGDREKGDDFVKIEQRWDYINLDDFKNKSCLTPIAYCWLWLMLFVSVSVYAVDTFTAVNLIAFDRWSGQIQPAIPFSIARWIFAGCIVASFILLFYRWWRAVRVMKQGGVAKSYLDPLAVRIQSIRMGKEGRGYKRFLVFAELTKSRKGADYVALFSYFSFEAWLRIIFAEGPRQVVNGMTLYTVMRLRLIPEGDHNTEGNNSSFVQFWVNLGRLADKDRLQAAILLGMLWTLIIWVLAALSLAISVILYLIYLWHHIPKSEGGLSKYCRSKINRRMERIVKAKVDKALKKENELRLKEEQRAQRKGMKLKTQPTLPDIAADGPAYSISSVSRQGTMTTLPDYESRPGSIRSLDDDVPPMPAPYADAHRPGPRRNGTQRSDASWESYNSNAPLMSSAGEMGVQTPMSATPTSWSARSVPQRSATGFSQFSDRTTTPGPRPPTAESGNSYQLEPLPRSATSASNSSYTSQQPSLQLNVPPTRSRTPGSGPPGVNGSYFPPSSDDQHSGRYGPPSGPPGRSFTYQDPPTRSFTPVAPPQRSFTPAGALPPRSSTPLGQPQQPLTSAREAPPRSLTPGTGPPPRSFTPVGPPPRSFTAGGPPPRSFTPQQPSPPNRSFTPYSEPTLPRLDTSMSSHVGYMATDRSATPGSARPTHHTQYQSQSQMPQQYQSYNRNLAPSQHNGQHRDSAVDDILNHY